MPTNRKPYAGRQDDFILTRKIRRRHHHESITEMMHRIGGGRKNPKRYRFTKAEDGKVHMLRVKPEGMLSKLSRVIFHRRPDAIKAPQP